MSASKKTKFRIRTYLPTGFTCTLFVDGYTTFAQLRNECWDKKSKMFGCVKEEARFRLYTTELFFDDQQTISYLVSVYPAFEGLGTIDRYSLLLISPSNIADKTIREKMRMDGKKPVFWQGYLWKCTKSTGKGFWKKYYLVFQNQTLMQYSNKDDFTKGKKAKKFFAIGSFTPNLDHNSCKRANKKWPFVLEMVGIQGNKSNVMVFAAESQHIQRSFVEVIIKCLYFRNCSMVLNILSGFRTNQYVLGHASNMFQVYGKINTIHHLQQQINIGNTPNFNTIISTRNIHDIIELLQNQLKYMISPIIPQTHHGAFIDIGRQSSLQKQVKQCNFIIKSLPCTSVTILSELFRFLNGTLQYASKTETRETTIKTVANAIGPKLLPISDKNAG
eukprot:15238_1